MELNSSSVHIGSVLIDGNGSNLNDPSETIIVIRAPYLSPAKERLVESALLPVVVNMIKSFESTKEK